MARLLIGHIVSPAGSLRLSIFFLLFAGCSLEAVTAYRFQPLKDTLQAYGISQIPEASRYPDVPAVAVLSLQEYKQNGSKHTRRIHKIVKILTSAGKEYTNLHIPCFSTCHIEARTIKAGGKIIHLPAKDMYRNQNLSGYNSPYFIAQFAMPAVEAGDIIEYIATVEYPSPFLLEDFRFSEPYPLVKGIFTLMHPAGDSYSHVRYSPSGLPPVKMTQNQVTEAQGNFVRTTFVVEDIRAALEEPYSPEVKQDVPGVRLILENRTGRRFEIFKDWFSYGNFVASQIPLPSIIDNEVILFTKNATGNLTDIKEIIRAIYAASEKRIQITGDSLWRSGFAFRALQDVINDKVATPHDFAVFLATCFKTKRWSSDLVLVNSHQRADTSKERVFPPDLDLVFLNVKTPMGEFLLDCNRNGMPPLHLSSSGMNRFALGIPLYTATTTFNNVGVYTSRTAYREGNRNHMDIVATPSEGVWQLDFRWTLTGEFQSEWVRLYRQKGEVEFRKELTRKLHSHLDAFDFRDLQHSFTVGGIELRGKATRARKQLNGSVEIFQNEIWDSGFDLRSFVLENRVNRLLLPAVGQISSTLRVRSTTANAALPAAVELDCSPIKYNLSFQKQAGEIVAEEKLTIRDMEIKQASFPKFSDFLDQYYEKHFWAILVTK